MFAFLFVSSVIQLLGAWGCYALARRGGVPRFIVAVVGGVLGLLFLAGINPLQAAQFFALTLLGLAMLIARCRARWFLPMGFVTALVVVTAMYLSSAREWHRLAREYPVESMGPRLAYETAHVQPDSTRADDSRGAIEGQGPAEILAVQTPDIAHPTLSPEEPRTLDEAYPGVGRANWRRTQAFRLLHASEVERFVNTEGFGFERMPRVTPDAIERYVEPAPIALPDEPAPPVSSEQERQLEVAAPQPLAAAAQSAAEKLHGESRADFANPADFGYVENRERVVGFQAHAFHAMPKMEREPDWTVHKLELVSLLKHEQPMVYISEHLPNMRELVDAPVRPLTPFEERALVRLRGGKEVEIQPTAEKIHMVGAIRAARQCLNCHSVEHGALLGAFSYELRRSAPAEALPAQAEPERPAL